MRYWLFWVAIGCWAVCSLWVMHARVAGVGPNDYILAIAFATAGWFLLIIAVAGSGKKSLGTGIAIFSFVMLFFLYWWGIYQMPKFFGCNPDNLFTLKKCMKHVFDQDPYLGWLVFLLAIVGMVTGVILLPIWIGKMVAKAAKKGEAGEKPESETYKSRVPRGRAGIN